MTGIFTADRMNERFIELGCRGSEQEYRVDIFYLGKNVARCKSQPLVVLALRPAYDSRTREKGGET